MKILLTLIGMFWTCILLLMIVAEAYFSGALWVASTMGLCTYLENRSRRENTPG